jgi:hypothetical protein
MQQPVARPSGSAVASPAHGEDAGPQVDIAPPQQDRAG